MNQKTKDLQSLWQNHNTEIGDVNMEFVKRKSMQFEKTVTFRNLRESIAGLFVAIIFTKMGLEQDSTFESIACYEIALSGVFISIYAYYHSTKNSVKNSSANSTSFLQNHKNSLKRQIKLLGSVRYWYVMPIATGYIALHGYGIYEALQASGDVNSHLVSIAIMLALGLFIIYLNEYEAVKELKKELDLLY